ncbi:PCI domain-containing protein 2 homolog isoform X2 [Paramacrobiotus metropolitanus]|nr:PCI domain-containing protein 2 homolog isoform X2 [Paramacrobiotus metropolitanus]
MISLMDGHADRLLSTDLCEAEAENSPEPSELHTLHALGKQYMNTVSCHLKVVYYLSRQDHQSAFNYQEEMAKIVAASLPKLPSDDLPWYLPVINTVARDLTSLALKCDQLMLNTDGQTSSIDRAFNMIQTIVRTCAAEKGAAEEVSKKRALVPLVNQLFRLCFRTGRANLCKPLVRTIENLKVLDRCPASQVVTFYYFAGKLAVVEGDYVLAEQKLTIAYQRCSKQFPNNIKSILRLLVPLRLRLDVRPSEEILRKYGLAQFTGIVQALQRADISLFQRARDDNERDYIRWSIFYLIDNLRLIMFRHVFRKLWKVQKAHIIAVSDLTVALRVAGYRTSVGANEADRDALGQMPTDADAECIVVNLIGEELVKAYVSWAQKKVVVSKTDAFPSLRKG